MKKAIITLVLVFLCAALFATGAMEYYLASQSGAEEPVAEPVKAPVEGMKKLIVLNNAFDGLELSKQVYNAKEWHKCYSLGEIVKDNFWFQPQEDSDAATVAFTDFYEDRETAKTFMSKYVSLAKDNEKYDYDLFVGMNQKETYDVKYKGYCTVGSEALIFVPEDGWSVEELMEILPFVEADTYDLVTVDGKAYRVDSDKIGDFEILPEGRADRPSEGERPVT